MLMNIPEKNTESNSEKKPENSVQHSWLDLLLTNLNRENGVMKRFCEDRKNDFGDFCKWIFTKDRICNSCNFQRRLQEMQMDFHERQDLQFLQFSAKIFIHCKTPQAEKINSSFSKFQKKNINVYTKNCLPKPMVLHQHIHDLPLRLQCLHPAMKYLGQGNLQGQEKLYFRNMFGQMTDSII